MTDPTTKPAARLVEALDKFWPEGCKAIPFHGQPKPDDVTVWLRRLMWFRVGEWTPIVAAVAACWWRKVARELDAEERPYTTDWKRASSAADCFQSIFEDDERYFQGYPSPPENDSGFWFFNKSHDGIESGRARMKRTAIGFMVFEYFEDYEQPLCLRTPGQLPNMPDAGVLDFMDSNRRDRAFLFKTKQQAREAIKRTEHYRLAFEQPDSWPKAQFCKIVMVETESQS